MDDQKLRAELDALANWATERHESQAASDAMGLKGASMLHKGEVRGALNAIAKIGILFDPPLEVVSEGPRYVVREKKGKDVAAFYTAKGE